MAQLYGQTDLTNFKSADILNVGAANASFPIFAVLLVSVSYTSCGIAILKY